MQRSTKKWPSSGEKSFRLALSLVLALADDSLLAAHESTNSPDASGEAAAPRFPSPRRFGLEARVYAISEALDLDAAQRDQLRKVLERRRGLIGKLWTDPSVPPDYRITAAHALIDKTTEQVREILNEEQRKRYKLAQQPRPEPEGEGRRSVDDWMNAMKPK